MRRFATISILAAVTILLVYGIGGMTSAEEEKAGCADGKALFEENKCNMCHAVGAAAVYEHDGLLLRDRVEIAPLDDRALQAVLHRDRHHFSRIHERLDGQRELPVAHAVELLDDYSPRSSLRGLCHLHDASGVDHLTPAADVALYACDQE